MTDDEIDVFDMNDEHVVSLRKNGCGQWVCISESLGLKDKHDLAPIPKDSRLFKMKDGKFCKDEHYEERLEKVVHYLCKDGVRVKSCDEIKKAAPKDWDFDDHQRCLRMPEVAEVPALEAPKKDDITASYKDLLKEKELVSI
jgi:hypothetical protein